MSVRGLIEGMEGRVRELYEKGQEVLDGKAKFVPDSEGGEGEEVSPRARRAAPLRDSVAVESGPTGERGLSKGPRL